MYSNLKKCTFEEINTHTSLDSLLRSGELLGYIPGFYRVLLENALSI